MRWIFFILFLQIYNAGWSQNTTELKRRAKEFFAAGRYEDALTTLINSRELSRTDEEGRFLLALCYYQLNRLNESHDLLKTLSENEKSPYPECWFYLGKIYHARHQFVEAANYYKTYLKTATADRNTRSLVSDLVRRSANGQQLQYQTPKAFVESLGSKVNTKYDEFAPAQSPNHENRLYFSSIREGNAGGKRDAQGKPDERAGQYFSDMFFCVNEKGIWINTQPMPYQLNSPRHEVLLDFNKDGSALIYTKGLDLKKGDVIVDTFRRLEQRLVSSDPLVAPVRPQEGDEAPYFYNDTLIVFASNRAGGLGGLDLYETAYRNGRWTTPANLGADINTPYDETTPFLSRDGMTLYFSSNNPERSMGGLDVFKTTFVNEIQHWLEPKNVGLPINSAADEDHFRLAKDGFTGFFSSNRKDGVGQRDLYLAYFNDYLTEQDPPAVAYQEDTTARKQPISESIEKPENTQVAVSEINTLFFNTDTDLLNAENRRALDEMGVALAENPEQKLVITIYGLNNAPVSTRLYQSILNAEKAAKYLIDKGVAPASLFLRGAVPSEKVSQNATYAMVLQLNSNDDFTPKGGESKAFNSMLESGLHYKIQIASSKSEYKNELLLSYPHPMVEKIMHFEYLRYTAGAVTTFAAAQRLRQEIIEKGINGAFIVPYIHGIRADKATARKYVTVFPDLTNFLK